MRAHTIRSAVRFGMMTAASAGSAASPALAQSNVAEKDVAVKTPDGSCDAVLLHPASSGSWPAVLIWPDIMGLRPAFRDMDIMSSLLP